MNRYLKKTLIISASALMFLSVGVATNTVSARRYHSRSARHLVKRHSRRGHRRSRRTKKSRSKRTAKKRNRQISHKRWRRIKRYRTGYFDHYGTWHKYSRKTRLSRRNGRKVRKTRKGKRSKYYMNRRSHRKGRHNQRKTRRHHVSYAAKVGAARDENFQDVNNDRESVGVDPIQRSSVLDQIAQERSQQLVTNNSHYDNNGNWVAQDDLSDNGYDPDIWNGENIMSNSGYQLNGTKSGDQANRQWWTDEAGATPDQDGGHRMNIRNPDFQSIGIGATYVPSTDSWYMCQDFSNETPDQIDNGDSTGSQESGDQGQGQDDSGDGGATAVATAGGGDASADADGGAAAAAGGAGGSAVGGSATGGSATGGSVDGNVVTGGSAVGGAGGSASSVVGPTVGGGNGNNNSNGGASSSSGNGAASVNDDGVSVTSGGNGTFINGKKVNPSGTYNEPNGAKVTFNNGNVTVQGADGSESSSSL